MSVQTEGDPSFLSLSSNAQREGECAQESEESGGEPVCPNGKASLSDGFCWISCRKAAGAELPLTGCNEVIYLPNLVLGGLGDALATR